MTEQSSERLIRELTADLTPVRLLPPMHVLLGGLLLMWAAIGAASLWWSGTRSDVSEMLAADKAYAAVMLGLLLAGLGGSAAALAAMIPGRDSQRLAGGAMGVSGIAMAGLVCINATGAWGPVEPRTDLACMVSAALLAIPLVAWMGVWASQAWVMQPSRLAAIAIFGGASMGALLVHASCPAGSHAHFLAAHLGAGPVTALVFAVPLGLLLRRVTR